MLRTPPSIAPHGPEQDTYLVLDDLGRFGRSWRKTAEDATDRELVAALARKTGFTDFSRKRSGFLLGRH
jgi:hypothetical protein